MKLFRRALLALLALFAGPALAGTTQVAVAANFTEPAKEIAGAFHEATGDTAVLSFGASGTFYTQIAQGAPFEVLLSADAERPQKAEAAGLAVPGTRFTYATGRLVLYSTDQTMVDGRGNVLKVGKFNKLAIADPGAAPYGLAAIQTMQATGVLPRLQPRIVRGSSITQAYQFVQTGAAELGFVALSQVVKSSGGSRWIVPEALHAPIAQQAVLLKVGADNPAAKAFLTFLRGRRALAIIKRYGYAIK